MGSVFLKFLAGAAAGLLTGLLTEPSAPTTMNATGWDVWQLRVLLILGTLLGGVIGALDGLTKGGAVWIWRGLGLGALLGAVGINFGAGIGGGLANAIFGSAWIDTAPLPIRMLARTLFFVGIGVAVGAAAGGSSLNVRKLVQGAVGGLIGGAIGGMLFDPIGEVLGKTILAMRGQMAGEVGGPSRIVGWIVLGAMVALMIGLVERISRSAWLRADFGRNEFKEWPLDAAQNFVGRGETCHVILRGDPQIAPVHASIARQGGHFVISDAGTPVGTFVNGHRIAQASLQPGDVVQIGSFTLRFMTKTTQHAYARGGLGAPVAPSTPPPAGAPFPNVPQTPYGMPTQAMPAAPAGQPTVAFAQSPVAVPTLVAMDGPLAGRRYALAGPLEIGREATGIALTGDANASRRHAAVAPAPGGVLVTDLGSTNGTFVDGARVQRALARPGSLVRVGSTTFRIE